MTTPTNALLYGDDGALWATQSLWGQDVTPEPTVGPQEAPTHYIHQLLEIETNPPILMTTIQDQVINIDGRNYFGGLSYFNFEAGDVGVENEGRMQNVSISSKIGEQSVGLRQALNQRLGGLFAWIKFIHSTDGKRWINMPISMRGRLSNVTLQGNEYSVEIVSETIEAYNRPELVWNHENQLTLTEGQDMGFEFAEGLAEPGFNTRFPEWRT